MFWFWICVLKFSGLVFDLLGHPVMAHFCTPRSIPAHSQYLSNFVNWVCIDCSLFEMIARSSAYAAELMIILDVPNEYPFLLVWSQRKSDSKNMRKMYGLNVSP